MSLNPLNELKRRLSDHDTLLPKRLCLAKNIVKSHHFPSAPKERVVADWLQALMQKNKLTGDDLRDLLGWLNTVDDATSELKSKLIQIVSQFLQRNPLQNHVISNLLLFLQNAKMASQFGLHIEESLFISITLLQYLKSEESEENIQHSKKILNNIIKFYKDSKKKLEFIVKLLDGENLETIFSYLESDRNTVINLCSNIFFPMNKKSFFGIYLQTLVRKDNIAELIAEKGDNIQSVLKIMDAIFTFPKGRTVKDHKFLSEFIDIFVSCYSKESQLVFAFYIMVSNCLNMAQQYITPAMTMKEIGFEENSEKIKRNLLLSMLNTLLKNEVDINVRLTDTLGVKIAKVETKKVFISLLESLIIGQLKVSKKPDKATFLIIETALKLDPNLATGKINEVLPQLMATKKHGSVLETYTQMMSSLIEILFKLNKGPTFISEMLPRLKTALSPSNFEQFELKKKARVAKQHAIDFEKIRNKIITGNDLIPEKSMELYGTLISEMMFRQNKDYLSCFQNDFQKYCIVLEEEKMSPTTMTLCELMTNVLCTYLRSNKMADHTVPENIAQEFWEAFQNFDEEVVKKFIAVIVKYVDEPRLLNLIVKLTISYAQLKLLNLRYSNCKVTLYTKPKAIDMYQLVSDKQCHNEMTKKLSDELVLLMDELFLVKVIANRAIGSYKSELNKGILFATKVHVLTHLNTYPQLFENNNLCKVVLSDLEGNLAKQAAKIIITTVLKNGDTNILKKVYITINRNLQNELVLETVKNMCNFFDKIELLDKAVSEPKFNLSSLTKNDVVEMLNEVTMKDNTKNDTELPECLEILNNINVYNLEEPYQLVAILMLLIIKKNSQKKIRKTVDRILLKTFEVSPHPPDLYKLFPMDLIFSFEDKVLIDLLTLKIKTSNNLFIIKSIVESAVKRVRTESELVKNIVDLLLKKQSSNSSSTIDCFGDAAFQISCTILPVIVKQKKAITVSAYRSILADLQEKLHLSLLDCFKNINFKECTIDVANKTNPDESMIVSESTLATLNAIAAYSLTLAKYCETSDVEEVKNLDYLWSGLEFFVKNAIQSIQARNAKNQHVSSSIRLLSTVLRYYKKLESHEMFQSKDKLLAEIWTSLKARLCMMYGDGMGYMTNAILEDVGVTVKFLCELVSVECFATNFVGVLTNYDQFENPTKMIKKEEYAKSTLTSHKASKYLWTQILKANIVGPKCVALSKYIYQNSRNLKIYIQTYFEGDQDGVVIKSKKKKLMVEFLEDGDNEDKIMKVDDTVCEVLKIYLDTLSEAVLAAKKINLDYKALDSIFELLQAVQYIMGRSALHTRCEVSWQGFFVLFEGVLSVLNGLVMSRDELLEDRWPCFMQVYRSSLQLLCSRAAFSQDLGRELEDQLGLLAHSLEKLTQSLCKKKAHISRISAYTVADICSVVERTVPCRSVRQHLERATCLLLGTGDAPHTAAFLRRGLATIPGHASFAHARATYRAVHKYTGNA